MRDNEKTEAELLQEAKTLRKRVAELRQTEEALRESEQKWRSLLNNTPDIVMIVDRDGTIRFINHKVQGIKEQEAIGKKVYDYISPEHHDTIRKDLEQVFQTGQSASQEISGAGPHGSLSWYQAKLGPIRQDERIVAVSIVTRDITERKWTEEALRESENKYRKLFNDIADPIFVADFETGILIDCNRAASELVGREKSDLIGRHQRILHPPKETEEEFSRTFEQHCKEKRGQVLEAQVITKKGEIKDVAIRADFTELEGEKRVLFGMFRDITERKRAEEAIRESEKRYRALFQGTAEGIIVADIETMQFKYVNPAICKMLDYTEDELTQMGVRDIHPKEDLEYIISEFEAQARGEKTLASNIPCLRKDGTIIYADINSTNLLIDGRECNVGFFTDITEHKRAGEELNEYREKMARAEQLASLGTLSATLAHELNQPLTVINLTIDDALTELEKMSCGGSVAKKLKESLNEVSNITSIVARFLKYARISSEGDVSAVSLQAVAKRIVNLLSGRAQRAGITLRLEGLDKLPPVHSNEKDLEQIFFSLVDNSIQAAEGKKSRRLIISGDVKGEHVELRFADKCGGIAPENLDRIFEPFFTTRPAGEGTGLGLCVVQRIISQLGGKVRVESQAGKGSTFFVTLPVGRGGRS